MKKTPKRAKMLKLQFWLAFAVVAINFGLTFWFRFRPTLDRGVGTFTRGNCSYISMLNTVIHVALNIVSSLFLAAGNYCMQLLVAPTRYEVNCAHAKGHSLEIGVPSFTNIYRISRRRSCIVFLLGFLSAFLHLFWNSAIFISRPVAAIPRAIVTSDFLDPAAENWTISDPLWHRSGWLSDHWAKTSIGKEEASRDRSMIYELQGKALSMAPISTQECIERLVSPLNASESVIVVASNMTSNQYNGSSLLDGWVSIWDGWALSALWICRKWYDDHPQEWRFCTKELARTPPDAWILSGRYPMPWTVAVDRCLVSKQADNEERCGLHYSLVIQALIRHTKNEECSYINKSLVTIGDAVHSFLEFPNDPDLSPSNADHDAKACKKEWAVRKRVFWLHGVGKWAWLSAIVVFIAGLSYPVYSVLSSLGHLRYIGVDIGLKALIDQGFKVHPAAVSGLGPWENKYLGTPTEFLINILIANSPQILMSVLYLFYNNILTRQLAADEWLGFLKPQGKKPLRVSSPIGMQRSSYFLTLPFKYSGTLLVFNGILHWLISQALFLVRTSVFKSGPNATRLSQFDTSGRGYSPLASILALGVAVLLILLLVFNSVIRRYKDVPLDMQRVCHNSRVLETLCRRPTDDRDAYLFPIGIGMVMDERSVHAGCVALTLEPPSVLQPLPPLRHTQLLLIPAEIADAQLLSDADTNPSIDVRVHDEDPAVAHAGLGDVGCARVVPDAARRPQAPAEVLGVVGAAVERRPDAEAVLFVRREGCMVVFQAQNLCPLVFFRGQLALLVDDGDRRVFPHPLAQGVFSLRPSSIDLLETRPPRSDGVRTIIRRLRGGSVATRPLALLAAADLPRRLPSLEPDGALPVDPLVAARLAAEHEAQGGALLLLALGGQLGADLPLDAAVVGEAARADLAAELALDRVDGARPRGQERGPGRQGAGRGDGAAF
ncbi:uncharacterized protein PG998_013248 [Apiospora kogelbergensis]|uniref:uncharacterized protein n=1 Tax=Apiospora kogelbergensis TaxID=1337665 RepID=UPI0031315404